MISISVVIPTYNRAPYIGRTLATIAAQTRLPMEIIIVDDGSTDETETAISAFTTIPVRYVKLTNGGPCRARNYGIGMAQGEWIAFCDSDDLWRETYLERQIALIECESRLRYSFANSVSVIDDRWGSHAKLSDAPADFLTVARRLAFPGGWILDEPMYSRFLRFQPAYPSTVLVSRSLIAEVGGFNESFGRNPAEDAEFTWRCMQYAPIGMLEDPLVGIRKHGENFSGDVLKTELGHLDILRHALGHHPQAAGCASIIAEEISRRSAAAIDIAFESGRFDVVRTLAVEASGHARTMRRWLKIGISQLPLPLAAAARRAIAIAGDLSGRAA